MCTFVAAGGSTDKAHHRDYDDDALEWQVDYLHEKSPFNLYAYEDDYSGGAVLIAGPYTTKDEIRQTLRRYPRDEFMLRYEYYETLQVMRKRPGRKLSAFTWVTRKHKARALPLSFNHGLARHTKQRFRQLMWLSTGELHEVGTTSRDCDHNRNSPKGASAWQILSHFKGDWKLYVNGGVGTNGRGRIMYRIASEMAAQGATADEIETVIRSSKAFKSKSSYPSEGKEGQGPRWGDQEIQRLRRLAR